MVWKTICQLRLWSPFFTAVSNVWALGLGLGLSISNTSPSICKGALTSGSFIKRSMLHVTSHTSHVRVLHIWMLRRLHPWNGIYIKLCMVCGSIALEWAWLCFVFLGLMHGFRAQKLGLRYLVLFEGREQYFRGGIWNLWKKLKNSILKLFGDLWPALCSYEGVLFCNVERIFTQIAARSFPFIVKLKYCLVSV